MRPRTALTTTALAVLLLVPAGPAHAANATLEQPDGDVTDEVDLVVHLSHALFEDITGVRIALEDVDRARVGDWVTMRCTEQCDERNDQVWTPEDGAPFDPGTGGPFLEGSPLANGEYHIVIRVERRVAEDEQFGEPVHLAVPPSAPSQVRAQRDGERVAVTWERAPEDDVERHRVERDDGDGWHAVGDEADGERFVDEPGEGQHRYRVVAERPDGRGGMLETASDDATVEVAGEDDANDDGDGPGRDDDGSGRGDGRAGNGSPAARSAGEARAPDLGSAGSGAIPGVEDGEGGGRGQDGFAEELDYGDQQDPDEVTVAAPGGLTDRILDAEQIAVPIAAGMVLTATGLHLWRWLKVPV